MKKDRCVFPKQIADLISSLYHKSVLEPRTNSKGTAFDKL